MDPDIDAEKVEDDEKRGQPHQATGNRKPDSGAEVPLPQFGELSLDREDRRPVIDRADEKQVANPEHEHHDPESVQGQPIYRQVRRSKVIEPKAAGEKREKQATGCLNHLARHEPTESDTPPGKL